MSRPDWIEPRPLPPGLPMLHRHPLLHRLLASRVASAAEAIDFLDARPRPDPDPLLLPGMAVAIERIMMAVARNETIAIYGDYDVDGIAATAVLVHALRDVGADENTLIARLPTRAEGYGLNLAAIDELAAAGVSLLVMVDCGISDHQQIAYARAHGLDVVVIDHHQMTSPPAGAIVVSAQLDPGSLYADLPATGLAYLVAVGLAKVLPGSRVSPRHLLDLVALATVGDVVPLRGWNRVFVREGLHAIATRPRIGVSALCASARLTPANVTSEEIAFRLAPRINAAGRMETPRPALDLLLTNDQREAARLAAILERYNTDRRSASKQVEAEALAIISRQPELNGKPLLIVSRHGWRPGVLGLTAGRLVEQFGRPV
ncbi:MAG: DHH family phosphoesterase, partial [Chloroflexota bacterium]|nr:DHH family phosphoesterase [Chloroflexota bacterium]